jgi:hypothetical protein
MHVGGPGPAAPCPRRCVHPSSIYRGYGGVVSSLVPSKSLRRRPKEGEVTLPQIGGLLGVPLGLAAWAIGGCYAWPTWVHLLGPFGLSRKCAPHWCLLRTLVQPSGIIQKIPNFSGSPKKTFLYMILILWAIPKLLMISWIRHETPNNLRSHHY